MNEFNVPPAPQVQAVAKSNISQSSLNALKIPKFKRKTENAWDDDSEPSRQMMSHNFKAILHALVPIVAWSIIIATIGYVIFTAIF